MAEREVLIDSRATDNFICKNLLRRLQISSLLLETSLKIWNVDGTHNQDGQITHFTDLQVRTGADTKLLRFLLTNLGKDEVILGYPWLTVFEPTIHWKDATLDKAFQPVIISFLNPKGVQISSAITEEEWEIENEDPDSVPYVVIWRIHAQALDPLAEGGWETSSELKSKNMTLQKTTVASKLAQLAADKRIRTYDEMVPEEYQRYQKVFSEDMSHRFPPARTWDHAIELLPEAPQTIDCKVYPMTQGEKESLAKFIEEQLAKGYIRPSKSPYSSPFFFIKKKNGDLHPVQDYRRLNSLTVKNRYPLPLISELIDQVRKARLFTKLDIRWGYNNVQIKEGDEWKGAFKTNLGLYEPCVMFFGLTNSPSTFQTMMDTIFRNLVTMGEVIIYMDDILIATPSDLNHHRQLVHQVLKRLEEHDLYLKPEKCTFEALEVEYLGLIIGYGRIWMDPVKVAGVDGWKPLKNLTELRGFTGFINFYRRFTKGFSKIAKPLNELTKKDVVWEWTPKRQQAFEMLKRLICSKLVLLMPILENPFEMEVDASSFAIGATLSQQDELRRWHPVAYFLETLSKAERNYDIYDQELLAIVKSLRHWRTYLTGAPHQIVIHTNHVNLLYWKKPWKISRRVAREFQELSEYNFVLKHIARTKNARADALSRRSDYDTGEGDNEDIIVLPHKVFIKLAGEEPIEEVDIRSKVNASNMAHERTI